MQTIETKTKTGKTAPETIIEEIQKAPEQIWIYIVLMKNERISQDYKVYDIGYNFKEAYDIIERTYSHILNTEGIIDVEDNIIEIKPHIHETQELSSTEVAYRCTNNAKVMSMKFKIVRKPLRLQGKKVITHLY